MSTWTWLGLAAAVTLAAYGLLVLALVIAGRRTDARAVAGFIPDCVVLFRRLIADPRVPRSRKLLLYGVLVYLALPIDLIPDFIPVAGQLDDAIIAGLVLRIVIRSGGPTLVHEHWPGPFSSRNVILRLAWGKTQVDPQSDHRSTTHPS